MLTLSRFVQDSNRYNVLEDGMGMLPKERWSRNSRKRLRIRWDHHFIHDRLVLRAAHRTRATSTIRLVDSIPYLPSSRTRCVNHHSHYDYLSEHLAILHD